MCGDGELGIVLSCRSLFLLVRPALVLVPVVKSVASLACPFSRLIFLLCRLLCGDSIVIPEHVAFRSRVDLCQSLAGSDSQLAV